MVERPRIGVDIDGVLIDMDPKAFLGFCERELGWSVDYKAFEETHAWYKATGITSDEEISKAFERFIHEVEDSQQPIEGAHDALKKIGANADIYLITARTGIMRRITEEFLERYLPDVRYAEISMGNLQGKAQKIIDFDVDYYIDDSYREISAILEHNTVTTTVIPFPPFHSFKRWHTIKDPRVHWLRVWEEIADGMDMTQHPEIRKKAWEEIVALMSH